ncbi:hypothetical protein Ahy_B02g059026 isoform A [Arachis hypogaea]|uniref:Retrotransposon gag domain-containing protein n=1 Tax=Arachis hypogaea TaxID=3818 RepID=A0A445AG01_ARAHY|nr:hypothetical protein Ahy_B02g059026 isoform A [Arachis hypogaea]
MDDEVLNVNGGSSINDSAPVVVQPSDGTSRSESVIVSEISGFGPSIRFGGASGIHNVQISQPHSEYSRDVNVSSTSNAFNSTVAFQQYVEENHHDLVNLLTQQITTILNPTMADHKMKFDRLARQVERTVRIVDYDERERQDTRENNEGFENLFQNENDAFRNRENSQLIPRGQNIDDVLARLLIDLVALKRADGETIDDYMIRFKNTRSRCYVSLPKNKVLFNVHIPDLAHLAESIRQVEIMKKEKEKYKNERRLKSKPFSRKEKFSYVAMESSDEEFNLEAEVDLAELRKNSPYQKLKDRDVSLCPRCNAVFDAEPVATFKKERIKKKLAHREEQARQKHPI